ncbi:aminoglycoside adenylyltransferase family protein [uncultured Nitratireductor sp.]|uniref:aminoglycoside adenylyltransferase family protein n=1 Tax=uncultured Nitratireductor sp. TaxID=520953 RepID=UPI0025D74D9C|nr:aminoglycoside adenylyltransferase family protein [uncultured Nitratireductor sp.]
METRIDKLSIPPEATDALPILEHRLGSSLIAVHLHGSAVAEGLRKRSDVDLLAVVDRPLPVSRRPHLSADLMSISGIYPHDPAGRRPLEVVIVGLADLDPMPYPARVEFVYGEWLRGELKNGTVPQAESNPEFTLLLAQAREEAVPLIGPDIADLIPDVAPDLIRRAIGDLLPDLVETVDGDERNVLLTLARMWKTAATGRFVSKNAAADWARPQLSDQASDTLALARDGYLGNRDDDLHRRRKDVSQAVGEIEGRILAVLRAP